MKVFLISSYGESLELARKLINEKHEVYMYVKEKLYSKVGDGIVNVVQDPGNLPISSDLIIVDGIGSGEFVDKARKIKRIVIGPNKSVERLQTDPIFGIEMLMACDIKPASVKTDGIPAMVGAWFNGDIFLKPIFIGSKTIKLAVGDLGPATKSMGIVASFRLKSKLFHETLAKTQALLKSMNFIGFISLDCLINNSTVHVVRWNPTLEYPIGPLMTEMFLEPIGKFFTELHGKKINMVPVKINSIYAGITAVIPCWPFINIKCKDQKVEILNTAILPVGLKKDDNGYKQGRLDGLIGMAVGHGSGVSEAIDMAYKAMKGIKTENLIYRNDIGLNNNFQIIEELGWVK